MLIFFVNITYDIMDKILLSILELAGTHGERIKLE